VTEAAPVVVDDSSAVPIWARDTAFPAAPAGWGWVDPKDRRNSCGSFAALAEAIRQDTGSRICLVWTPENPRMVLPEEVAALKDDVNLARSRWTGADLEDSSAKLRWGLLVFAALFSWTFYHALAVRSGNSFSRLDQFRLALKETLNNNTIEIGFLILTIFVLIPWYQAKKSSVEFRRRTPFSLAEAIPRMRFEIWLERQKSPFTWIFLALMVVVGLAQLLPGDGTAAAGLDKIKYANGEGWRLFTAPFLHGNPIHFLMNAAALLYLGKRLEVFARWPHLPMVFLFSACVGGQASVHFTQATSVGASGGLMGWLGFLLVFETLHARLVPRSARRRLAAAVFLTALIGLLGHRFIDNSAHVGGLLAGMLYAAIVFPKSSSVYRPQATSTDRIIGSLALAASFAAAAFAIWKIAAGA
jgi:membrane associated rhomboid family serine protease